MMDTPSLWVVIAPPVCAAIITCSATIASATIAYFSSKNSFNLQKLVIENTNKSSRVHEIRPLVLNILNLTRSEDDINSHLQTIYEALISLSLCLKDDIPAEQIAADHLKKFIADDTLPEWRDDLEKYMKPIIQ